MEQKPSLILPLKRFRYISEEVHRTPMISISHNNSIKKITEEDIQIVLDYINNNPGEFASLDYWNKAISQGISLNYNAENLRLI